MKEFIEQQIINAIKGLLTGRVNEILSNYDLLTPIIEFGKYSKNINPIITLNSCEMTDKERIIRIEAYSLTISFTVEENEDSEIFCYGFAHAIEKAINEDPTLGGVVNSVTVTGKKYIPPKVANCGMEWETIVSLRVTVEGVENAS